MFWHTFTFAFVSKVKVCVQQPWLKNRTTPGRTGTGTGTGTGTASASVSCKRAVNSSAQNSLALVVWATPRKSQQKRSKRALKKREEEITFTASAKVGQNKRNSNSSHNKQTVGRQIKQIAANQTEIKTETETATATATEDETTLNPVTLKRIYIG